MAELKKTRNPHLVVIAIILSVAILVVVGSIVYYGMWLRAEWQREIDEFMATVPLGITQDEVRAVHGEPMETWAPFEAIDFNSFGMVDPREDDPTTVWFYYFGMIDGGFLYFDDEGNLVRVELGRT